MKKSVAIGIAIGGVLLIGVFAIVFVPAREPLSLTFLEYQPLRAKLKLTNNSSKIITYLTDQADTALFAIPKASSAGTSSLGEVLTGTTMNAATGKTEPTYLYADPGFRTNGGYIARLQAHDLKPGQSAQLDASLQIDGPPMRVGTICIVPQGKLAQQFGRWMDGVKRWCRMKPKAPGQVEVWCKEPLQLPLAPTGGTNSYDL